MSVGSHILCELSLLCARAYRRVSQIAMIDDNMQASTNDYFSTDLYATVYQQAVDHGPSFCQISEDEIDFLRTGSYPQQ